MSNYVHDPQSVLDYAIDWLGWLGDGETITASSWTVPDGITQTTPIQEAPFGSMTEIWLTGGTLMASYAITNHITTNQGREQDQTITLHIRDR